MYIYSLILGLYKGLLADLNILDHSRLISTCWITVDTVKWFNCSYNKLIVYNEQSQFLCTLTPLTFACLPFYLNKSPRGRVVKVADFIIALDHSIISPLWLVWVRAPHGSQVRQVKFYLRVCQVVFPWVLPFSPHLLIGSSRYEWNNLERDVKLNKKKL